MDILNNNNLNRFHKLFPELTPWQLEIIILYSSGLTQKEISEIKKISRQAVSKALNSCKNIYHLGNLESIRCVFLARLFSSFSI
ncbi:MarR family transcriptional regulator [Jejubacter calystegiae]|uniref:MarR family transcriptional regulator n=1 Tax=Jejubacter calystegiae TaxID=2579935 RepID=A0A4P8YGT6_9ENTR|nr:helix-turn-helix domain-containing protein [Jejubacter calystegiae]QCT18898.1 MarR family transcriptional regulator [Jejubacter calystegiae]